MIIIMIIVEPTSIAYKGGQIRRAIGWVAQRLPKVKFRQPFFGSP